ncbi:MAG TPA: DUF1192 domain-containing protein [Hyphomicrobiaceae bacterium]|jgi:uncharacterized small protein (DUF1192 family)|nr:DUF1192 domain-containing protein [Hyphomicrobiaceae bacterium]
MDWDDDRPKPAGPKVPITVGEPLGSLSIAELEARIGALTQEIERIREELRAKRAHEAAAADVFKR